MRTLADLFANLGLTCEPRSGRFNTSCPRCSHLRSKEHKRRHNCLRVNASDDRLQWHCFHCGCEGVRYTDEILDKHRGFEKARPSCSPRP
jgi:hypothetical protein